MHKKIHLMAASLILGLSATMAAHADAIENIKQKGVLVVGAKADYRPFGFLDESGNIVGFEPDLAADLAERLGVKLELVPVVASNRMQFLQQGRIDLILATLSDTPERHKLMNMVEPNYYGAGLNVLAPKSAAITDWEQLRGKKVCLNQGAYYNKELQSEYGVDGMAFPGTAESYTALRNGSCIAFAYDDTALIGELLKPEWNDYEMPLQTIYFVPWSIGVKLGEDTLSDYFSEVVTDWHKSGKILELEEKWKIQPTAFAQEEHAKRQ